MSKTIIIVDDNATNLTSAENALSDTYRVIALSSAAQLFQALGKFSPDLILLDIEMPEMDGFEAMQRLIETPAHSNIPVIFLTSRRDEDSEARGIDLGAVDFILKPFSTPVLLNRIKNHLHIDELIRDRTAQVQERSHQLERLQNGIVFAMADLVESRDGSTGGHIDRTTVYMELLIDALLTENVYVEELQNWDLDLVISSARLHDIGKIIISDSILNKPGKLTDDEFDIMKSHSLEGGRILDSVIDRTGNEDFLTNAKTIAIYHHEKWNGRGYPYGLKGTEIPLQGRLMAIVDVYDALVSERPYKTPFTHEKAVEIIMEEAGQHFDSQITETFYKVHNKVSAVRDRL
jgi:putative two-component system response regulator